MVSSQYDFSAIDVSMQRPFKIDCFTVPENDHIEMPSHPFRWECTHLCRIYFGSVKVIVVMLFFSFFFFLNNNKLMSDCELTKQQYASNLLTLLGGFHNAWGCMRNRKSNPEADRPRDLTYCSPKPKCIVKTNPDRSVLITIIIWHFQFHLMNVSILHLKYE